MHPSWFSLDGVSDLGDVTLVCDDDKQIQAHKLVQLGSLITGGWFSLVLSRFGYSGAYFLQSSWFSLDPILGTSFRFWSGIFRLAGSAKILGWEPGSGSEPVRLV